MTLLVQERTELPEPPVTLVGVRVQVRFVEFVVTESETVPVNPPMPCTVMELVAGLPVLAVIVVGLAVSVKSWTLKVTFAVWDRVPLVPVTTTV